MLRSLLPFAPALILSGLLLPACGDGVDYPYKNSGVNPFGKQIALPTGNAIVDQVMQTSARCGYQSPNTVPAGWKMVLVGEKGCAQSVPPTWQATGAGTNMISVEESAAALAGVFTLQGVPSGFSIPCTPKGVASFVKHVLGADGCTNMTELYYKEYMVDIVGLKVPAGDLFVSCTEAGVPMVGVAWVSIMGTSPLCNILTMGFWMAQDQISQKTCYLTQAMQSYTCPQGGSYCSASSCSSDCVQAGHSGGACDANDNCVCK